MARHKRTRGESHPPASLPTGLTYPLARSLWRLSKCPASDPISLPHVEDIEQMFHTVGRGLGRRRAVILCAAA
jgi:hypothetical protein